MAIVTEREFPIPASRNRLRIPEGLSIRAASLVALLVFWQLASFVVSAKYVPGPLPTFAALWENAQTGALIKHFNVTMVRMLVRSAGSSTEWFLASNPSRVQNKSFSIPSIA